MIMLLLILVLWLLGATPLVIALVVGASLAASALFWSTVLLNGEL